MNARKPNVLFLLTDQHNAHVAGFAGNEIVNTENLDRLASQSVQFDAAYCQSPICTASRISLWTGLLTHHCGGWNNSMPIFPELQTVPEHFGKHGYATCGVGKMHTGGDRPMNGFQKRPYGDLIPNARCSHQPDPIQSMVNNYWTNHQKGRFCYAGPSEIPESMIQDNVVTLESLAFIHEHGKDNPDKPWFLCASYQRPHHPLTAPKRYFDKYWPDGPELSPLPNGYPSEIHPHDKFIVDDFNLMDFSDEEKRRGLAGYYACVDFVDDCIGELIDELESNGILDNTIIIYTSDHGDLASEHGLWWKRSYYEGSSRSPLLIKLPEMKQNLKVDTPVELLDLFPTLCELCELPVPEGLHGESLAPLMDETETRDRRKKFARSQYLQRPETGFRMIRTPRWKYVEFMADGSPPVLFDMVSDPGETENVAGLAENSDIVEELRKRLWEDGETWESLVARRESDTDRAGELKRVHADCGPNQFSLGDGTIVDSEYMLYKHILESDE